MSPGGRSRQRLRSREHLGGFGVDVNYSPDTIVGEPGGGNVIGGNGLGDVNGANVDLYYSTGSVVQSNFIGTDITGTVALSTTTYYGVALAVRVVHRRRTHAHTRHGTGQRHLGQWHLWYSTEVDYRPATPSSIEGNIVGADPTGEHAVPNLDGGIRLY